MSRARAALDWRTQLEVAMDPERARELRGDADADEDFCSMCGKEWCAVRRSQEVLAATSSGHTTAKP